MKKRGPGRPRLSQTELTRRENKKRKPGRPRTIEAGHTSITMRVDLKEQGLRQGLRVQFDVQYDVKGDRAVNVKPAS